MRCPYCEVNFHGDVTVQHLCHRAAGKQGAEVAPQDTELSAALARAEAAEMDLASKSIIVRAHAAQIEELKEQNAALAAALDDEMHARTCLADNCERCTGIARRYKTDQDNPAAILAARDQRMRREGAAEVVRRLSDTMRPKSLAGCIDELDTLATWIERGEVEV
jgi:hypothetical protein